MGGTAQKKGKTGNAAEYLTRAQALRKLQISLADFRRLCILKGIYPRDPKRKLKGNDKTYYHIKDIRFLACEPLLHKFREIKTFMNKVKKALGRKDKDTAKRLEQKKPTYTLEHLLKERYPVFVDALRDLDDALCTLEIFAALPANDQRNIPAPVIQDAAKLVREFKQLVANTQTLSKTFVSIKGYYYQAEFLGQKVTWLSPHQFAQYLPVEVDFKVLLTFLEFYRTLLAFVNFKLLRMSQQGLLEESQKKNNLFSGRKIFIAREVPLHSLRFVIEAAGGQVGWQGEGSPFDEKDQDITHFVVDRTVEQMSESLRTRVGEKDFIQPQWVFDCVNRGTLLPCGPYAPGKACPPHLSPFVDNAREGYMPTGSAERAGASTVAPVGDEGSEASFDEIEKGERELLESDGEGLEVNIDVGEVDEDEPENDDDLLEGEEKEEKEEEEEEEEEKEWSAAEKKRMAELERRRAMLGSNKRKLYDIMTTTNKRKEEKNRVLEKKAKEHAKKEEGAKKRKQ